MPTSKNVNRLFLATVVIYILGSVGSGYLLPPQTSIYLRILIPQALILVPILVFCRIRKVKLREIVSFGRMKPSTVVLTIVCTYLLNPLLVLLNMISLFFTTSEVAELTSSIEQNLLLNTLMIAVLPAIIEELMFRGVIFHTYRKQKVAAGVLLSAFLFGCMHMNFNQFIYTFVFGIYLALLVEATGSIFSSMIAHFTMNFSSVLLTFLMNKLTNVMESVNTYDGATTDLSGVNGNFLKVMDEQTLYFMIVFVVVWGAVAIGTTAGAIAVYIAISKISGRYQNVKMIFKSGTKEKLLSLSLIAGIVISFIIMIFFR